MTMLVREVADLLAASHVGLYEFVWLLRSLVPEASDEQRLQYAHEALQHLVDDGVGQLVMLTWPKEQVVGRANFRELPDDAWEDPVDRRPYVALARS